ncbi:MAG: hypothetical protein FJ272_21585 [Planctomycetes bacterium]|nr:hypothetical protein [Planctomycetota bacterium]
MKLEPWSAKKGKTWTIKDKPDVEVKVVNLRSGMTEGEVETAFARSPERQIWLDPSDSELKVRFLEKVHERRKVVGLRWTHWFPVPRTAGTGVQVYAVEGYDYKAFAVKSKVWVYELSGCRMCYVYFDESGRVGYVHVGGS